MTDEVNVLAVLRDVQWGSVAKTFGNCHSTLIGAVVQAWNGSADGRFALEPGCSSQHKKGHTGTRIADAILCQGEPMKPTPIGVLEVECNPFPAEKPSIFERLESYWRPDEQKSQYFKNLSFAVVVVYPQTKNEKYDDRAKQNLVTEGRRFLDYCAGNAGPDSRLFVVIAHKRHEGDAIKGSVRALNPYYRCTISNVEWLEITRTGKKGEGSFFPR
jgi:hypothetical protein